MISALVPVRIDHMDRIDNMNLFLRFYGGTSFMEVVVIEDGCINNGQIEQLCSQYPNVKYKFVKNESYFQKGLLYNEAFKISTGDFIVALDVDVIINRAQIKKGIDIVADSKEKTILIPYNGASFYTTAQLKNIFRDKTDYETLERFFPPKIIMQYSTPFLRIPNIHSSGGCVIFKREDYLEYGGFNPNFRGWGYEDDEVLYRYQRFGFKINRLSDPRSVLWHLHHEGTIREANPHLMNNRQILLDEKEMDDNKLKAYIEGWKNG